MTASCILCQCCANALLGLGTNTTWFRVRKKKNLLALITRFGCLKMAGPVPSSRQKYLSFVTTNKAENCLEVAFKNIDLCHTYQC